MTRAYSVGARGARVWVAKSTLSNPLKRKHISATFPTHGGRIACSCEPGSGSRVDTRGKPMVLTTRSPIGISRLRRRPPGWITRGVSVANGAELSTEALQRR